MEDNATPVKENSTIATTTTTTTTSAAPAAPAAAPASAVPTAPALVASKFTVNGKQYVLIKELANIWGYASSYQLIVDLVKNGFPRNQILKTDESINKELQRVKLIDAKELNTKLFYSSLYSILHSEVFKTKYATGNHPLVRSQSTQMTSSTNSNVNTRKDDKEEDMIDDEEEDEVDDDNVVSEDDDSDNDDNDDEEEREEDEEEEEEEEEEEDEEEEEREGDAGEEQEEREGEEGEEEEESGNVEKKNRHHHIHKYKHTHKHKHKHKHKHRNIHSKETKHGLDDKVTISQVFPQYGIVESTINLNHASFGSLNAMSKLSFYKNLSSAGLRFLPNTKLNFAERELVANTHNFGDINIDTKNDSEDKKRAFRRPIGRSKKHNIHIDPNLVDLNEAVIPGQGYISEFSINHLCKVPNYYVTSNHQTLPQSFNAKNLNTTSNSSFLFNEGVKMSKNIQQLVFSNDSDNYSHSKYYYTKCYRGPGSGNYKDAALMNKINKIHLTNSKKKCHKKTVSGKERFKANLKGLIHERFNKDFVDGLLSSQRRYTEDYSNLEMLHNSLEYNVLLNSYREISRDTWSGYFKFKLFDFEQYKALEVEKREQQVRQRALEEQKRWMEDDKLRQERLRIVCEEEHKKLAELQQEFADKRSELETKNRRFQLEPTFNDPFDAGNEVDIAKELNLLHSQFEEKTSKIKQEFEKKKKNLIQPLEPPPVIETPQLDVLSKFTSPAEHPEILRHLPTALRSTSVVGKEVPSIKKPIQYVTTYPVNSNAEYLTRIEIVKIPNPNSIGWDNLRKFQ
ncbi:hypothetical protein KGF56_004888 [Candida oxycetoniae]|uniref:Uncharacterized protein n=1 Tax=Candida oxycetoniae TaxID=497107 RepID=A0AAI9WVC9_9ASCO|nr:uncharacterized protein KGF56_004888 [Candida oxycetoniae]KAI3402318.2 hypothetical protein KGF56_004888 [Candida oxycetoniae]